ncbi:hypothetical protein [Streptomyces sp. NBC_01483]|uniref:hypothetical protein n=1 Tax=Streptomyces sp. NBC_01483 TaxID=2903883 RepID=UPI002E2FCF1E|nr:hypothetical protein [Streptomyces sp. NBC_01483]
MSIADNVATEQRAGALMEIMGLSYEDAHHLSGPTRSMVGHCDEVFGDISRDKQLQGKVNGRPLREEEIFHGGRSSNRRLPRGTGLHRCLGITRLPVELV